MGKQLTKGGSECPSTDQYYRLEQWSNVTLFLRKTSRDCISSAQKSLQVYFSAMYCTRGGNWKGDIMVADIEESEQTDASKLYARRLSAREVLTSQRSGNFIFPVADGTLKIFGKNSVWEHPP